MLKNSIIRFVLIFFGVFILLKLPFHGLEKAFDNFIIETAESITKSAIYDSPKYKKKIMLDHKEEAGKDMMIIGNIDLTRRNSRGQPQLFIWKYEIRGFAYLPMIIVISLIAASPVPWKRKLFSLPAGIIFILLFISFKMFIIIMTAQKSMMAHEIGYSQSMINIFDWFAGYFITENINPSIMVALILWIAVTFRKSDIDRYRAYFSKKESEDVKVNQKRSELKTETDLTKASVTREKTPGSRKKTRKKRS